MTTYSREDLPIEVDQVIVIGDDWIGKTVKHKNPDGSAINLSGFTIAGEVEFSDASTETILFTRDDAAGEYYPYLPRTTTANFTEGVASYSVSVTNTLDKKLTYFGGDLAIREA